MAVVSLFRGPIRLVGDWRRSTARRRRRSGLGVETTATPPAATTTNSTARTAQIPAKRAPTRPRPSWKRQGHLHQRQVPSVPRCQALSARLTIGQVRPKNAPHAKTWSQTKSLLLRLRRAKTAAQSQLLWSGADRI